MERIKDSRVASFVVIALVYVVACSSGICVYLALPFAVWLRLLIADAATTVVTFVFSMIFGNASVYDPYWSVQPPVILAAFAIGRGVTLQTLLPLIAVMLWGIRLTANWAYTFKGLKHEDWRYRMFREKTGGFYPIVNFFGIHLMPTVIVYLCILPAVLVYEYTTHYHPAFAAFLLLSLAGTALEFFADIEMQRFRRQDSGLIRVGLWKYSRHPNYLGEILMWWGIGLYSVAAMPARWYLLAGALANTLMFLFISIPMADKRQSRKPGYERYKAETRMLLPVNKKIK